MSATYQAIGWNRQKRRYDAIVLGAVLLYLALFAGVGALVHPNATAETLLIRGLGTLGFLLLHITLAIGPLTRLDRRFLPLLYNRRHLGVALFLVALGHGAFAIIQFHALGNVSPLASLFETFPGFQIYGFFALLILFMMAATSHDMWLHRLGPLVWKRLHMLVYVAYALLVTHVSFGALRAEPHWGLVLIVFLGIATLSTLHILAARKERAVDSSLTEVCNLESIPDGRAVTFTTGGERIAVYRQGDRVHAVSSVCRHQGGPLAEGKIIDGCITCPWHGYQYDPATGRAPAPYNDVVPVFPAKVLDGKVYVGSRV